MAQTVNAIKNFCRRLKEFVRRLQRLEDGQKKKWLISLAAVTMIFFIGLWLIYIDVAGLPKFESEKKAVESGIAEETEESFWKIIGRGWREISGQTREGFGDIKELIDEQIEKSNEIILNNNTSGIATTTTEAATSTLIKP